LVVVLPLAVLQLLLDIPPYLGIRNPSPKQASPSRPSHRQLLAGIL